MTYLTDYEQQCRALTGPEQLEENALAFKEWRNAQRNEHHAYERWLVICGVRMEVPDSGEAVVLPFPRREESLMEGDV